MKMKNNPVTLAHYPNNIKTESYCNYGRKYRTIDLIEKSKEYDVFDLSLNSIDLSAKPWEFTDRIADLADHFLDVQNANLDYPIILDSYGYICNGWHRIVKALLLNHKTIKAVRLIEMPNNYTAIEKDD